MYIIVSATHPRHCQRACILPVSKLPGTWREKLRAITEPPLRGVSSLQAQQPDSVSMGTLRWSPGCRWHHLMYIFRYQTSPFSSEIVFSNGLNNMGGQRLSPTDNIEHTHAVFSPPPATGKLKPMSDLTLRCTIKSYYVQLENCRTAVRNSKKPIPPNLPIVLSIILCNCLFAKNRRMLRLKTKTIMWRNQMEVSRCHSWIWGEKKKQ